MRSKRNRSSRYAARFMRLSNHGRPSGRPQDGRKNHLFAESDGGVDRWATVCPLITTAKLNDVEPFTYLKDVLERMSGGHPMSHLDELRPWNWRPNSVIN
jgi:hypothetical protein